MLSLPIKLTRDQTSTLETNDLVCVGVGAGNRPNWIFKGVRLDCYFIDLSEKKAKLLKDKMMGSASAILYFLPRAKAASLGLTKRSDLIVPYAAKPRAPKFRYATPHGGGHIEKFRDNFYQNIFPNLFDDPITPTDLHITVDSRIKDGNMKELTRAQFLAQLKLWGLKEDGTKIAPSLKPSPAKKKFTDKNCGQVWQYRAGGQNYHAHICMFSEGDMLPFDIKTGMRIDDTSVIPPHARMIAPTLMDYFKNKLDS